MTAAAPGLTVFVAASSVAGLIFGARAQEKPRHTIDRAEVIARAQVWSRTDVPRMNLKRGPDGPGAFAPGATIVCDYDDEEFSGNSPKFSCVMPGDDELKVKYGGTNGEVYGEVAASRLLWALGFGADRMYPVRVVCRGCPRELGGLARLDGTQLFDPAVVERKAAGEDLELDGREGWSWEELDRTDPSAGGATKAQRDALTLMAAFLQHTDSKPEQQRVVCLEKPAGNGACARPFLMINDVGLTFGRANWTNANAESAMNLDAWSGVPVWKDDTGCTANLARSMTGTLHDPVISEEGRRFLASLLMQLTDAQLHDLFEAARVTLRPRSPASGRSGFPAVDEWVDAFEDKRQQIAQRRCQA